MRARKSPLLSIHISREVAGGVAGGLGAGGQRGGSGCDALSATSKVASLCTELLGSILYTRTDINGMGGGSDDLCYGFSRWILRLSVMLLLCVHGQAAFYMGICIGIPIV